MDTNIFVGYWLERDPLHRVASRALRLALRGTWGTLYVSDYIIDEAVTFVRYRGGSHALADDLASFLVGEGPHPPRFRVARVGTKDFSAARAAFHQYDDKFLSFTDCTSITLVRALGLRGILSSDGGFDGLIRRIDPADEGSLAAAP